jgi:hypothetical protein
MFFLQLLLRGNKLKELDFLSTIFLFQLDSYFFNLQILIYFLLFCGLSNIIISDSIIKSIIFIISVMTYSSIYFMMILIQSEINYFFSLYNALDMYSTEIILYMVNLEINCKCYFIFASIFVIFQFITILFELIK